MKTASAKSKGRNLQKKLAKFLEEVLQESGVSIEFGHVRSTPMGVAGPDLFLAPDIQSLLPFDFECKNHAQPVVVSTFHALRNKNLASSGRETIGCFKQTSKLGSYEEVFVLSRVALRSLLKQLLVVRLAERQVTN